ncbi:MAG: hypothetical protein V2J19_02795 [Wenzhouxiangella sp.]|jgi:hypothetical protein|nr:hypothetical protein [Wenzhouxiangella sp.]
MSDNTHKLLSSLAEDPETLERFKKDPQGVMKEYGVPEDHQKLILSGDKAKLAKETGLSDQKMQLVIL